MLHPVFAVYPLRARAASTLRPSLSRMSSNLNKFGGGVPPDPPSSGIKLSISVPTQRSALPPLRFRVYFIGAAAVSGRAVSFDQRIECCPRGPTPQPLSSKSAALEQNTHYQTRHKDARATSDNVVLCSRRRKNLCTRCHELREKAVSGCTGLIYPIPRGVVENVP